jgi:hypothetical protein
MLTLEKSAAAWGTDHFEHVLKAEIAAHTAALPLQQALARGSAVADAPVTILLHRTEDAGRTFRVRAGVFYESLVGGCSCTDDPTPASTYTEYCEIEVDVEKTGGAATVRLLEA